MRNLFVLLAMLSVFMVALTGTGCTDKEDEPKQPVEIVLVTEFPFTSTAFGNGERIPVKYTCQGPEVSPPLQWSDPPQNTQSFTLIFDDPDGSGGTFDHWVLYNIPPETRDLPENVPTDAILADGSLQGKNGYGKLGYIGPCPPSGNHRYVFRLYALDTMFDLAAGASKPQVLTAIESHVLAESDLMGTYSKQ